MNIPEEYKDEAYFLDDMHDDIIVVVNRQSERIPERFDRVVWSKSEKRFIYGDISEYWAYYGDDDELKFDASRESQDNNRGDYSVGLTQCGSSFYDEDGKLYEIKDIGSEHELIFDVNKPKNDIVNTLEGFGFSSEEIEKICSQIEVCNQGM